MTNFEKLTASPEVLAAFLASIPAATSPWDENFQQAVCTHCPLVDCEPCPHEEKRNNPLWWLGEKAEDAPSDTGITPPENCLDYKAVFAHFGIDLDEYARKVQESGGTLCWGISSTEKAKEYTANMAGFGTEQSQRIIVDYDKEYGAFLVRQELGMETWQSKPDTPPRL